MPTSLQTTQPINLKSDLVQSVEAGARVELSESPKGVRVVVYGNIGDSVADRREFRASFTVSRGKDGAGVYSGCEVRIGQQLINSDGSNAAKLDELIRGIDWELYYHSGLPEYVQLMDKVLMGGDLASGSAQAMPVGVV